MAQNDADRMIEALRPLGVMATALVMRPTTFVRTFAVFMLCAGVGACVQPPARAPAPPARAQPEQPVAKPTPRPAAVDWFDRAPTPGNWRYATGTASYGQSGNAAFILQCERGTQRVMAIRPGVMAGAVAGTMTLRATTGAKDYVTVAGPQGAMATLSPGDPQLDALVYSRGRILIALAGAPDLILPSAPELNRVVDDCR
jgi:hypothetical protein